MIHIGFGLHDKDGHYSVWVGTVMQSILEHTDSRVCFHILYDETLSTDNKYKLEMVAHNGSSKIEFHKIDEDDFSAVKDQMSRFTIGTMFRCSLPGLLPDLNRIIYLDADLFVNRDIKELWDVDIREYCLAGVVDEGVAVHNYPRILNKYPEIKKESYFNAGVLYMNLKKIREFGNLKKLVLDFLIENPEADFPDQDALNVLFHNKVLYLDVDLIVNNDLKDLWNININDYYCAAVKDLNFDTEKYKKCIGMSDNEEYINAGVILFNLKKLREDNIAEKYFKNNEIYKDKIKYQDQDVINITLSNKIKIIDSIYNFTRNDKTKNRNDAVIIHFFGAKKPWKILSFNKLKQLYYYYYIRSPYLKINSFNKLLFFIFGLIK